MKFASEVSYTAFDDLTNLLELVQDNHGVDLDKAFTFIKEARADKAKVFFIGNGGSAAIASHMAQDYQKAGKIASMCFNDASALTALANDLGYERVFSDPLAMHARSGDVLFAISSSGQSPNILNGARRARERIMTVITLSGFEPDNPLRKLGHVNFYVPASHYGLVEITHLAICHQILDRLTES